jgi:uncharacterized membrane protein
VTLLTYEPNRSAWLFFIHIAAAFVFFGGAITVAVASIAAGRARSLREAALLARLAARVDLLVVWPSLVILVGAGAQLASAEDAYGEGWLRFGLVLTGIVAVIGVGLVGWLDRRRLRAAERLLATGGDTTDELERLNRSPILTLIGTLSLVLLVIVFWLMTAKPGIYG